MERGPGTREWTEKNRSEVPVGFRSHGTGGTKDGGTKDGGTKDGGVSKKRFNEKERLV